jgi:uncharacterized protein YndB with AHSA1/START domain
MSTRQLHQNTDLHDDPGRLLAAALSSNAVFSAACGLTLLAGAPALSGPVGIPAWLLAGMGMGLVVFAGFLLWVLAHPPRLVAGGRAALAADVAWVAGGVVLLVGFPSLLTTTGNTALAVVTGVVAALAAGQAHGLRRIRGRAATGTSRTTVHAQRVIAAPPARVWAAVADVADYARFTSTIAATELVSGAGEGMVRACTDERGGRWSETCTLWDEGRRYTMTVNVGTYPLYYRVLLHELTQTWSLKPTAQGTLVSLTFDARLKLGVIGVVVGKVLARQLRIEDILAAYEHDLVRTLEPTEPRS